MTSLASFEFRTWSRENDPDRTRGLNHLPDRVNQSRGRPEWCAAGNRTNFGDEATYTRRRGHVFVRLPNGQAVSLLYGPCRVDVGEPDAHTTRVTGHGDDPVWAAG